MNILYLAHPGSVHDIKWMEYGSGMFGIHCFCIAREADKKLILNHHIEGMTNNLINFLGYIPDFSVARPWQTLRGYLLIRKIIKTHKIDLLHIMYAEPNALWVWGKKYLGIPVLITTRGSDILITIRNTFQSQSLINQIIKRIYKSAFLKADYITCTSALQMETIRNHTGRNQKMEIIRTGIDLEKIQNFGKGVLPKVLMGKKYVLFPRNMRTVYNHELALDAIDELESEIKMNYTFVFVDSNSSDTVYVARIRERMQELINCEIVFLPLQDKQGIFALYANASLVVMTPRSDGSPVSAMEAMAFKIPVLLPSLLYDEGIFNLKTVSFFKNLSPLSLSSEMSNILKNFKLNDRKLKYAYNCIQKSCNYSTEMFRLQEIILRICKSEE